MEHRIDPVVDRVPACRLDGRFQPRLLREEPIKAGRLGAGHLLVDVVHLDVQLVQPGDGPLRPSLESLSRTLGSAGTDVG